MCDTSKVFCPSEKTGGYYKTALSITGLFFSSKFLAMAAPVGGVRLIDRILVSFFAMSTVCKKGLAAVVDRQLRHSLRTKVHVPL